MKLKDRARPSIPPLEGAVYMAVCTMIVDLGQQYSEKFKKADNKILFSFDIPSETIEIDGENKPRQLSQRFTWSTSPKSTLYKTLCSWLSKKFSEDEIGDLELFDLIGKGCQVQVSVSEDGKYNNIDNIMALPKGMPVPVSTNPPVVYSIDEHGFSGTIWDSLPEWVREIVEKSEQYQQDPPAKPLDMPPEQPEPSATDAPDADGEECPI